MCVCESSLEETRLNSRSLISSSLALTNHAASFSPLVGSALVAARNDANLYRPLYMFVGGCIGGEPGAEGEAEADLEAEAEVEANADDESLTLRRRPYHALTL